MDFIRLRNLVFHAYHGVTTDEQENGQRFEIDVELGGDFRAGGLSDDIRDTIDYARVNDIVTEIVTGRRFNLIEALAETIAGRILTEFPEVRVKVVVRKPEAPLSGEFECAEVEINRPN